MTGRVRDSLRSYGGILGQNEPGRVTKAPDVDSDQSALPNRVQAPASSSPTDTRIASEYSFAVISHTVGLGKVAAFKLR